LWEEFCQDLNICIIAKLVSDFEGKEDRIITQSPLLTGNVHYLSRGEDVSSRPMVQALACVLVGLSRG
jgi:CRISPR-associated protein Csx3